MKHKLLELRDPLAIVFLFLIAVFFIINLNSCGGGYFLTGLESLNGATLEGEGDNTPPEVIIGPDGTLIPGDEVPNDGWTPPVAPTDSPDTDNDGFPNGVDYFPDRIFYLCVASYNVSSAEIQINNIIIFGTDSFNNTSWLKCRVFNPKPNDNQIAGYTINGSPGDKLELAVKEWDPNAKEFLSGNLYFAEIVRGNGTPQDFMDNFSIQ